MYIDYQIFKIKGRAYRRVLLREGERINSKKVKLHTIANLSHCTDEEVEAIRIALKYKNNLNFLYNLAKGKSESGKIYGPTLCLDRVSQQLGIKEIFENYRTTYALLSLWLIYARFLGSGSRLSALRQCKIHAGCEVLGIESISEDELYRALDWLEKKKGEIEEKIFIEWKRMERNKKKINHIFLYDISSSYLEGEKNELGAWGYNRDGKRGKKIITYGLLTDEEGDPLSIEVFPGNTSDNKTVKEQIDKIKERYRVKYVTFVGDKGMIKSGEQELISKEDDFYYITSITKAQIESLIKNDILPLPLFDKDVCEIIDIEEGVRYILRRNPIRAEDIAKNRNEKIESIKRNLQISNQYLKEHRRAKVEVQKRKLDKFIEKLKLNKVIGVKEAEERKLRLEINDEEMSNMSKLDGCYVIKTNVPMEVLETKEIHDRYKDLFLIEQAFKESKSLLEVRGIYVRKKERTIAHMIITMLAYKIERYLRIIWGDENLTVMEGIEMLKQIGSQIITIGNTKQVIISKPQGLCEELLKKTNVKIPWVLPYKEAKVLTRKKLQKHRK